MERDVFWTEYIFVALRVPIAIRIPVETGYLHVVAPRTTMVYYQSVSGTVILMRFGDRAVHNAIVQARGDSKMLCVYRVNALDVGVCAASEGH